VRRVDSDLEVKMTRIEASIKELERRMGKIEVLMYGDGSSKSIIERITKLETKVDEIRSIAKLALYFSIGTFLGIIVTIVALVR
jgi:hypothetical protein